MLTSDATGAVGASIMDWDYRVEYNQTYTLDVQHAFTPRTSVEVSVLASRTVGADSSTVRNIPQPGPGAIAPRRPVPELGPITAIRWDGWGLYHSATVRLDHRMRGGASLGANYTLSKSMDDASDPGATVAEANVPQDVYDERRESALSSYDHRHRFVANLSLPLPFGGASTARWRSLVTGWRVSGIATLQSGAPFTVNLGVDRANVGPGPAQRPERVGSTRISPAGGQPTAGSTRRSSRCPIRSRSATPVAIPCSALDSPRLMSPFRRRRP